VTQSGPGKRGQSRGWPRARLDPAARPAIALRLGRPRRGARSRAPT
jgi:hypothetical protein